MPVIAGDRKVAGKVTDVWVDRAEALIRYLEVEVDGVAGRHVLVPMTIARVNATRGAVHGAIDLRAPFRRRAGDRKNPDQVTKLEEDKIAAYFAGGTLYATPDRMGPLL